MHNCMHCGNPLPEGQDIKNCPSCGHPISQISPSKSPFLKLQALFYSIPEQNRKIAVGVVAFILCAALGTGIRIFRNDIPKKPFSDFSLPSVTIPPTGSDSDSPLIDESTDYSDDFNEEVLPEMILLPHGGYAPASDFIFPYSSIQILTSEEIDAAFSNLDDETASQYSQLAINEIYARYGYHFHPNLSESARCADTYFCSLSWYTDIITDEWETTGDVPINQIETANIDQLVIWMKSNGYRTASSMPNTPELSDIITEDSQPRFDSLDVKPDIVYSSEERYIVKVLPDLNGTLRIRTGPSTDYSIIDSMPSNTKVEVIGKLSSNSSWVVVYYAGQYGWVCVALDGKIYLEVA